MNPPSKIHFISIGGSVMHNLALELQRKGYVVTGSDDEIYDPAKSRLATAGLLPKEMGWSENNITPDLDMVLVGMHARKDNPELAKAQKLGLKILSYPEFIYDQCVDKQRVAISGSHGKTTITAIILHVLRLNGYKFGYLIGAGLDGFENMVHLPEDAPTVVLEGDEYFSSPIDETPKFLHYQPHMVVISGLAWDHFNVYPTWEAYVKQFEALADSLPKAGNIIFDETDDMLDVIGQKERVDVAKFPYEGHPHRITNGRTVLITKANGEVPLLIFGEHNMKNISAAKIICERLGITDEEFYRAIQSFKGASLRLELLSQNSSTSVFRDFAHAPSKVGATTRAMKGQFPKRKLIVCAELHTFSSLNKDFIGQYKQQLDAADEAVIFYNPRTLAQKKLPELSEDIILKAFKRSDLRILTNQTALKEFLLSQKWAGKNLLMMGSGTFGGLEIQALAKEITGN